mgnify:FL=1
MRYQIFLMPQLGYSGLVSALLLSLNLSKNEITDPNVCETSESVANTRFLLTRPDVNYESKDALRAVICLFQPGSAVATLDQQNPEMPIRWMAYAFRQGRVLI